MRMPSNTALEWLSMRSLHSWQSVELEENYMWVPQTIELEWISLC